MKQTLAIIFVLTAAGIANADLVADYQFDNTFSSSIGSAADLIEVNGPGSFGTALVGLGNRTVFNFLADNGLRVNTSGLIANTEYTAAALFEFDDVAGYKRILDTSNLKDDFGVYNTGSGTLGFCSDDDPGTQPFGVNTYVQFVMTRNGTTGLTRGYLNGVESFSFIDASFHSSIDGDNQLVFFKDDSAGGENASGSVARIQLYDEELTSSAVATLDLFDFSPVPEPSVLTFMVLGLLGFVGCRRRGRIGVPPFPVQ